MHNQPTSARASFAGQRLLGWCVIPAVMLVAGFALFWGRSGGRPDAVAQDQPRAAPNATQPSDDVTLDRFWYAVVDLRNRCAIHGESGWDAFLSPQARRRLSELNREVWG